MKNHLIFLSWTLLATLLLTIGCDGCSGDPLSEIACETTICYNGGEADRSYDDLDDCACICPPPFTGRACLDCRIDDSDCQNRGTVNTSTCTCDCPPGFSGERCQNRLLRAIASKSGIEDVGEIIQLEDLSTSATESIDTEWTLLQQPTHSQAEIMDATLLLDEPGSYLVQLKAFVISSPEIFHYDTLIIETNPAELHSFDPMSVSVLSLISIQGKNFSSSLEGTQVWFHQSAAPASILAASPTTLEVQVPLDAQTGQIRLHIVETAQDVVSEDSLEILRPFSSTLTAGTGFTDMEFADDQVGLVTEGGGASGGIIYRTEDGGQNWNQVYHHSSGYLNAIDFASPTVAYVSGSHGSLLKSEDGGHSWTVVELGTTIDLFSVSFPDVDTGYVAGEFGTVFMTYDGGDSWSSNSLAGVINWRDIEFSNGESGFFLDRIPFPRITTDAGMTWQEISYPALPNVFLRDVHWADPNWLVVGDVVNGEGLILRSTDGMDYQQLSSGIDQALYSIDFSDAMNGVIVGEGGTILRTSDGGINWADDSEGLEEDLRAVHLRQSKDLVIMGIHTVFVSE
ncbi:MAG: YCF48-related protein [Bacteroidota bacterium]